MTNTLIRPWALAAGALVLGVVFDVLFFGHMPGLSVTLFTAVLLGTLVTYDKLTDNQMSWYEVSLCGLIFLLSAFFTLRASEFLLTLNGIAMVYLFGLLMASLYGAKVRLFRLIDFIAFPFIDLIIAVASTVGIVKYLKPSGRGRNTRVIRGTVLGVVLGIIFLVLFVAADPVFAELLRRIVSPEFLRELIERTIDIVVVFFVSLIVLAPAFWKRAQMREIEAFVPTRQFGIEAAITLAVSNAIFAVFIIVRSAYLFGGDARLAEFDLTYAEYAREGFFQLLVVALIVTAIVWVMRMVKSGRANTVNRVLQVVLILQTGAIIASSWMALSAYESVFGLTHMRLFSHYFLVVVGAVLVLLAVGVLMPKLKDAPLLHAVVFIFAIGLLGLNVMNPDMLIANHNIDRYAAGEELDYRLLFTELSADAAPAISTHLAGLTVEELEQDSGSYFYDFDRDYSSVTGYDSISIRQAQQWWRMNWYDKHEAAWQSYNVPRAWAFNNAAIAPESE